MTPQDVLAFWTEAGAQRWFTPDASFDALCRERVLPAYRDAAEGRLAAWEDTADGALALVLLLDQMPRHMFRGEARSWATDEEALRIAEGAIGRGFDEKVAAALRRFFYLPHMHAEDLVVQDRSVELNARLGDPEVLTWARHHRDVVARFGRFPHRNDALGRSSDPDELSFLSAGGFRG